MPEVEVFLLIRHSEQLRFYQRAERSRVRHRFSARDPSLRLKGGFARDDVEKLMAKISN
jgi:hypothetical protein